MFTMYRRDGLPTDPAPMFDPALVDVAYPEPLDGEALIDPLTGAVPTWRLDEEPIYLEVLRDLGVPALDEPAAPAGDVVVGELTDEGELAGHVMHEAPDLESAPRAVPCLLRDEPEGPPTRALRILPPPTTGGGVCRECHAFGTLPCREPSGRIRRAGEHHGRTIMRATA